MTEVAVIAPSTVGVLIVGELIVGLVSVLFESVLVPLSTNAFIDCCVANSVLLSDDISSSSAMPVTVAPLANANDVDDANAPDTVTVPSTINASLILIVDESEESSVVPLILSPLIKTSPVPLGCNESSALDPFDEITFVVNAPVVTSVVVTPALAFKAPDSVTD